MLFLLLGCESFAPTWIDQRPACSAEPYAWTDDLESWVASGPGDGSFDLDPEDDARINLSGEYDPSSGAFGWSTRFDDDYWMSKEVVTDGAGTAWHNGDLDVLYTLESEDILGATRVTGVRTVREGCDETTWTWDPELDEPVYTEQNGTWGADSFAWVIEDDSADWSGTLESDLTRTTDYVTDTDDEHIVDHPDGTRDRQFTIEGDSYDYEGSFHTNFDGSYESDYEILKDGDNVCTVSGTRDYSGDGSLHYECGNEDFDCDYTVKDDGTCTYDCTDGESGKC